MLRTTGSIHPKEGPNLERNCSPNASLLETALPHGDGSQSRDRFREFWIEIGGAHETCPHTWVLQLLNICLEQDIARFSASSTMRTDDPGQLVKYGDTLQIPSILVVACHMTMGLASGDLGFTPSG
ncbi:predicted protein [Plenodomus lingam JN3]|uniref:Predicted protein n=1 Tax=Leptosphaeria maculans (strain JN3 / isolate v23.1.3 / race Av1-4-5-6-7-8) TaxID=985895 RepID=E5R4K9_LEPMJ|nr:predicted protein [Plenodomus lingam JN3]CBX91977.1 predicted protein [Plenodomus lingam JN3]